jgi:hypothetical protein
MKTTLTIPEDILPAVRQRAEATGKSLGDALADMAREGLGRRTHEGEVWRGVPLLPFRPDEYPVTLEKVNSLRDGTE